jgi:histidine triad (HIT) family protein
MNETDCLFCKILAGSAAADVIYQDNRCVVIRDINPQAPTHLLVIPREHMESLDDASQKDESLLGHLLRISARVAYEHGLSESGGYRTVINTGERCRPVSFPPARSCAGRPRNDLASGVTAKTQFSQRKNEKTRADHSDAFFSVWSKNQPIHERCGAELAFRSVTRAQ